MRDELRNQECEGTDRGIKGHVIEEANGWENREKN